MSSPDTSLISWSFALAALGYLVLAGYLVSFGSNWRTGLRARRIVYRYRAVGAVGEPVVACRVDTWSAAGHRRQQYSIFAATACGMPSC